MAQHTPHPAAAESPWHFERAEVGERRAALGVLLRGRAAPRDAGVEHFLRYSQRQGLSLDELWVVRDRADPTRPLAAAMLIPAPGRSAMLFVSPAPSWPAPEAVRQLVAGMCQAQDPAKLRLVQALLEPDQQRTRHMLRETGFTELATLIYMHRRPPASDGVEPAAAPGDLGPEHAHLRVYHWDEAYRARFAGAIEASYEQTLDCPALRGLRDIDDVIAGHMAAGVFRPDLWYALYDGERPAAVMLLNDVPQADACELVYLGLAVDYRGRGLAHRLLEHGLRRVGAMGGSRLMLAVDERNEPAMRLYRGLGFVETGRKCAMIQAVG
ncbi:MAG: GNAT family N-acetyltransferase [Phycisphaeraceae bacterium]